jgi:hypothetical protein
MDAAWPTQYVCIGDETYCSKQMCQICPTSFERQGSHLHLHSYNNSLANCWPARLQYQSSCVTHCIIYGQTSSDTASGRIDIQVDGFRCLLCFEKEKLRNDECSVGVPNLENHSRFSGEGHCEHE